tara:strand:- start:541 stop:3447 length:2907 start_codon:yes stop_codon:yes gene_type:complete
MSNLDLQSYLWQNRIPTGNKDKKSTHTRIGLKKPDNKEWEIYPGNYNIVDIDNFYKLYANKVFIKGQEEYLTESQNRDGKGPILVDLDFRFKSDITERQYDIGIIQDIIELYCETLVKLFKLDEIEMDVFVMEKPNINKTYCNSKGFVKDGLHILFTLSIDHASQLLIREKVLECIGEQILDNSLDLTNKTEDVLDISISKGDTNWQLFGSRKPKNEAYELTHHFKITFDEESFDMNEEDITSIDFTDIDSCIEFLKLTSAKNDTHYTPDLNEVYIEEYNQIKNKKEKHKKYKKKKNIKLKQKTNEIDDFGFDNGMELLVSTIINGEILDEYIEKYIMNQVSSDGKIDIKNENVKQIHNYTMILNEEFYGNYASWIKVGWALHNTNEKCFLSWLKFSSKWDEFDWDTQVEDCWEKWNNMREIGYSDRSIKYWARECDKDAAQEIYNKTLTYLINQTLNTSYEKNINGFRVEPREVDLARLAYHMFKDYFRCGSIKGNIWYEFKENRWQKNECGTGLRRKLSDQMSRLYVNRCNEMMASIRENDPQADDKGTQNLIEEGNIYNCIALKLKNSSYKDNVLKECKEVFYDSGFEDKLNAESTKTLLCFKNGIFDFEKKEFRKGIPEDYISKCTRIRYVEINRNNEAHLQIIKECEDFMEKLFPNLELRRYMWDHLASCLLGTTHDQTFNIYNGAQGSNGKSKLREFMALILGEYAGTVPITLITQKRKQLGGTSSEVAQLKGLRYACMDEPSEGDQINEGIMKQITGGDPLQARELYHESFTFIPQFKLVCCTNHLPDIKSTDGGTWRRIRIVEFESTFKETIEEVSTNPEDHEYLGDQELGKKLIKWAPIMASLLIEIACEKELWKNKVDKCDMVMKASKAYQEKSDYLSLFMKEKIIKGTKTDKISKTNIIETFKQWYNNMYPGEKVPGQQKLQDYLDKNLGKYKRQGWWGYKIRYDAYNDDVETDDES